jgi:hypothetical protein
LFLELVEAPEGLVDRLSERAARGAARLGSHDLPEHRVVPVPATVVANRVADRLGNRAEIAEEVVERLRLQLRSLLQRGVQVVDVRLVMLPVVNLHRLRVDVRLEGIRRVGKGRKRVGHGRGSPVVIGSGRWVRG